MPAITSSTIPQNADPSALLRFIDFTKLQQYFNIATKTAKNFKKYVKYCSDERHMQALAGYICYILKGSEHN